MIQNPAIQSGGGAETVNIEINNAGGITNTYFYDGENLKTISQSGTYRIQKNSILVVNSARSTRYGGGIEPIYGDLGFFVTADCYIRG